MARNLADVLHHFLPDLEPSQRPQRPASRPEPVSASNAPRQSPLLCVPVGERDVVRSALAWNLAVEMTRWSRPVSLLTPSALDAETLWPEPGTGPLGLQLETLDAADLEEFAGRVDGRPHTSPVGTDGLCVACVPRRWLERLGPGCDLLRWWLVFARPEDHEQRDTYRIFEQVTAGAPHACLGVSVYGVRSIAEARRTFAGLASTAEDRLGCSLRSYGLLVEDLDLCRSIVNRQPVGLARPRSLASRALADVARMLLEDASGVDVE